MTENEAKRIYTGIDILICVRIVTAFYSFPIIYRSSNKHTHTHTHTSRYLCIFVLFFYFEDNGISTHVLFLHLLPVRMQFCKILSSFTPGTQWPTLPKSGRGFNVCARCSACIRTRHLGVIVSTEGLLWGVESGRVHICVHAACVYVLIKKQDIDKCIYGASKQVRRGEHHRHAA